MHRGKHDAIAFLKMASYATPSLCETARQNPPVLKQTMGRYNSGYYIDVYNAASPSNTKLRMASLRRSYLITGRLIVDKFIGLFGVRNQDWGGKSVICR